jgi:hypothetical protein
MNLPFNVLEVQAYALELAKLREPHTFCQHTVSISLSLPQHLLMLILTS